MRILFVHPNYRSGGAEIAGTWPPAWVAYWGPQTRETVDFRFDATRRPAEAQIADREAAADRAARAAERRQSVRAQMKAWAGTRASGGGGQQMEET